MDHANETADLTLAPSTQALGWCLAFCAFGWCCWRLWFHNYNNVSKSAFVHSLSDEGSEAEGLQEDKHEEKAEEVKEEAPDTDLLLCCSWTGPEDAPKIGSQVPQLESGAPPPTTDHPSWAPVSGRVFRARQGPDYSTNKVKASSLPALYDCVGVDIYRSKKPVYHIASQLQLPQVERDNSSDCVPSTIVLNVMVPTASPSMFSQKHSGETVNVVFCFVMRKSTATALKQLHCAPAAVQLLHKYFRDAPQGHSDVADRFKLSGKVCNWEEADLPAMLSRFNGKPTLVTKSGTWYSTWHQGAGHAELDCNTAYWCYMARKALHSSWKVIGKAVFDFGVVVEGRDDSELPEQMLASAHLNHVRLDGDIPRWEGSCAAPSPSVQHWRCSPESKKKGE